MVFRRVTLGALAAFCLVGSPALAAPPAPSAPAAEAPSPRALALAKRYFADLHMDQLMGGVMHNMLPAMMAQMAKEHPEITTDQRQAVVEAATESSSAMMDKLIDRMAPLFAATFSEKELQDLVNFYESPTGKAMMAKMPVLMAKMQPTLIELMPEMQADMKHRLCAKLDCTKLATPAAPKAE
jgi:hypothetical protein